MWSGILFNLKKKLNNAICSKMDGPRDRHTEQSKSDKYHITSLICGIFKK